MGFSVDLFPIELISYLVVFIWVQIESINADCSPVVWFTGMALRDFSVSAQQDYFKCLRQITWKRSWIFSPKAYWALSQASESRLNAIWGCSSIMLSHKGEPSMIHLEREVFVESMHVLLLVWGIVVCRNMDLVRKHAHLIAIISCWHRVCCIASRC